MNDVTVEIKNNQQSFTYYKQSAATAFVDMENKSDEKKSCVYLRQ